jgi:hypothetical protein
MPSITAASCELEAGAPGTEVTPQMIEAGVAAYLACDREFDPVERIVREVFEAMVRPPQPTGVTSSNQRSVPIFRW